MSSVSSFTLLNKGYDTNTSQPYESPSWSIQLCADLNTNEVKSSTENMWMEWCTVYLHCYLFPSAKSVSPLPLLSTEGAQAIFPGVHRSLPGGWDAVQHPSQSQAIGIQEGNSIIIIRYIRCISVCGVKPWNKLKGALRPLSKHERVRTAVQTCGYQQVRGRRRLSRAQGFTPCDTIIYFPIIGISKYAG